MILMFGYPFFSVNGYCNSFSGMVWLQNDVLDYVIRFIVWVMIIIMIQAVCCHTG